MIARWPWLAHSLSNELWLLLAEGPDDEAVDAPRIYDERHFPDPPDYGGDR